VINDWVERQKTDGEETSKVAAEGEERTPTVAAEEGVKV
jgi:hypothetical protein